MLAGDYALVFLHAKSLCCAGMEEDNPSCKVSQAHLERAVQQLCLVRRLHICGEA